MKRTTKLLTAGTLAAVFGLSLYLNALFPYLSDDWHFFFTWVDFYPNGTEHRVTSFSDILLSMGNYYRISGGRVLCHFAAYCLLCADKWLFNVLNAAIFTALVFLLYRILKRTDERTSPYLLPLIALSLFCFLPSFGDNVLWLSGAVNYLWPSVWMLFCMHWVRTKFADFRLPQLLLFSLAAGVCAMTNETTGGMLGIVFLLTCLSQKRKPLPYYLLPLLTMIAGTLVVILSPGNAVRRATIEKEDAATLLTIWETLQKYVRMLMEDYLILLAIVLFAAFFTYQKKNRRQFLQRNAYAIAGLCGILVLAVLGFYSSRPVFLGIVPLLAGIWLSLQQLLTAVHNPDVTVLEQCRRLVQAGRNTFLALMVLYAVRYFGTWEMLLYLLELGLLAAMLVVVEKYLDGHGNAPQMPSLFQRIRKCLPAMAKLFVTVLAAAYLGIIVQQTVLYTNGMQQYRVWTAELTAQIQAGEIEAAKEAEAFFQVGRGSFFPEETRNVPRRYLVEWMGLYYDVDVIGLSESREP